MLGLRSKVRELSTRMARSACRSSSRVGGLVRLPIDLEVGRESVASSKKALPSSEDHESACKQQHRTGEVSQEQGNAPSIRGALGSSAQCRHRRRQAEGSEAPQHRCPGSLKHLGVPVPLVRQNFFRCTSSSQKQGRTMAGAAMAAVVRRLAAAHARGRARTPVLAKLGMKPVARPTRLHRSPGRGTRPMATPELSRICILLALPVQSGAGLGLGGPGRDRPPWLLKTYIHTPPQWHVWALVNLTRG